MTSKSTLPPQKMNIDLASIGRELKTSVDNVEAAVKLLDGGNTIPFITRFRKDQTGGLTEDQLLTIKTSVTKLRALSERKAFIVKSIGSQDKLSDELSKQIEAATSSRELEDIYHPFKARKQTLATIARQNGLEPLAMDIFEGREPEKDLASRATDFVRVDKDLNSVDEVIAGVGHILAEKFSDHSVLRKDLRGIIADGKLTTKLIEIEEESEPETNHQETTQKAETAEPTSEAESEPSATEAPASKTTTDEQHSAETKPAEPTPPEQTGESDETAQPATAETPVEEPANDNPETVSQDSSKSGDDDSANDVTSDSTGETDSPPSNNDEAAAKEVAADTAATPKKKKKRKKKKKKAEDPYKEYHDFAHSISKMPYHKTLAINRGEKNGRLKVKIQFNDEQCLAKANSTLVPDDHPFGDFLQSCVKDAMNRLVAPSLEREMRREITEAAEKHAVSVFARNLKNLLLQSPVRDQRVVAIDPGYKRGCSVAVLNTNGELLENEHIFVVGNEKRIEESKQKLIELINKYSVTLIAIGNGAACREAEQIVSDMIKDASTEKELKYAIVNEAGASFYSTSEVGREEFPDLSPAVRSAVSIGRRLMDPLSELVKISPANIGVGLYQHDVRAKHLADSLDDVVQFCVNRVGVDVNTASTSLMKYVSGMNQLTARRVLEFRQENGPFKNREELKKVTGFGEATFVQAAGFLRVHGGDQPLDTTGIHPEFYDVAAKIIEQIGGNFEELFPIATATNSTTEKSNTAEASEAADSSAPAAETEAAPDATAEQSPPSADSTEAIAEATPIESSPPAPDEAPPTIDEAAPTSASENSTSTAETANQISTESQPEKDDSAAEIQSDPTAESNAQPVPTASTPAPEPKPIVKPVLRLTAEQSKRRKELIRAIRELNTEQMAGQLSVGRLLMKDILQSLCRPEYDPRNNVNRPVFRSGIIKIDDLKPEMCLDAQVVNVVDFGVFVDIGLGTSCLVHVSQLSNHFIRDPHRFYAVGDSLKVWVTEVETEKRRVKLTAVQPGSANRPKRNTKRPKPTSRRPKFQKAGKQSGRSEKKFTKARRKPKPVKPITDDMLKGSEPMRSFSDLAQFFDKKPEDKGKKD